MFDGPAGFLQGAVDAIHAVGGTLFLGRLAHCIGLSDKKPTAGRVLGMALTFLALSVAGGMLLVHAFV